MAEFKFGFEESWFRLILKWLPQRPDLFASKSSEDAQTLLRIGKLKVVAAKNWAEAAGLIEKCKGGHKLTQLAEVICKHDPDLDEDGVWWVIHYFLARRDSSAWFYSAYCNEFDVNSFSKQELDEGLYEFWDKYNEKALPTSTYEKTVYPSLRNTFEGTRLGEDFGIFKACAEKRFSRELRINRLPHKSIFAFALLDWAQSTKSQTVNTKSLLEPFGIGKVFQLPVEELEKLLDKASADYAKKVVFVSYTAGLNSVALMDVNPLALVAAYYHELDGATAEEALRMGLSEVAV